MASFYNPELSVVPSQKLPMSEKTDEWKKACVNAYVSKFYFGNNNDASRKLSMKIAYDLYNSVFDELDFKYITDPYKVQDGFPASVQNFNIIKPKIDLLLGEESKRPFTFKVIQTNDDAASKLQETYKENLMAVLMELAGQGGPEDPITDKDIQKLEQVDKYMSMGYSDVAETCAYHTLNYLMEKEEIKTKFMVGFHDWMAASMAVFYTGQLNGEPILERVNPLNFSFDYSPEVRYIEDGEWAIRRMRMTPTSIYDRFYDLMDEHDLDTLITKFNYSGTRERNGTGEFKSITWRNTPMKYADDYDVFTGNTIDVWHVTWKSLKKVGFVTYIDDNGDEVEDIVDETYKPLKGEDVRWDWVVEVWEGYRIGDDLFLGLGPVPEQAVSVDNPNSGKLPYCGSVYNNINTAPKSLIDIMKPIQYMYMVVWYRLELALARDKGKIINMDVTQIPKSMGVDVNKWLHYLSAAGVNLINPYEDGWDIPGREGGKPSSFNQFSQVDLSMSDVIVGYIELMNKIEDMMGELSGVSRQRQGQVQSSELVGNVQQSIIQTSHITEGMFFHYNQVKRRALTNLLNVAKNVWRNSGKKKLHYLTDDAIRVFMDLSEDFLYSDYDIFISDSTKENQDLDMLKSLYQPAMQNGASLLDIANIMTSNNLTEIKNRLEKIEKAKQQRETEMQQMQQDAQMQQTQAMMQAEQTRAQLEQAKLEVQENDSIRKAETAIQVALINAKAKVAGDAMSADGEEGAQEDTTLEVAKLRAKIQKDRDDSIIKMGQLKESIRHNMATETISRNKPKPKPSTKK